MNISFLEDGAFDHTSVRRFVAAKNMVDDYTERLTENLQFIHRERVLAYLAAGLTVPKSWASVWGTGRLANTTAVSFKGLDGEDVTLSGTLYLGGGEYDEFEAITPLPVAWLSLTPEQLRHTLAEHTQALKAHAPTPR